MYQYTNSNTREVKVYPQRSARLDALPNWECVEMEDDSDTRASAAQAVSRAEAERYAIEEAAATRGLAALRFHEEAAGIAAAAAMPTGTPVLNLTASHTDPLDGEPSGAGVLAGKRPAAVTHEEKAEAATAASREADKSGVLARAKADQASGVMQTRPRTKSADDLPAEPKTKSKGKAKVEPVAAEGEPVDPAEAEGQGETPGAETSEEDKDATSSDAGEHSSGS